MEALGIEARPSCMLSMHSTTELYPKLNAEFQRIARRDKKAFLSYQCKDRVPTLTQTCGIPICLGPQRDMCFSYILSIGSPKGN